MQIVIDIDENIYTRLFDNCKNNLYDMRAVCYAVRKGTIIPKGHGRLIDESDIEWAKFKSKYSEYDELVHWEDIEDAPTIISADKEAENDE